MANAPSPPTRFAPNRLMKYRYRTTHQNHLAVAAYAIVFLSLYVGFTGKVDSTNLEGSSGEWLGMLLVVVTSTIIIFGIFVVIIELLEVRSKVRENWASFVWCYRTIGCFSTAAETNSTAISEVTQSWRSGACAREGAGGLQPADRYAYRIALRLAVQHPY